MTNGNKEHPRQDALIWHANSTEIALNVMETTSQGLSEAEASLRLARWGANIIEKQVTDSALAILWRQINNPLIWVLMASSLLAVVLGKVTDGLVVLAVVVLNSLIGFFQEAKAGKAIQALVKMIPESTAVLRDGKLVVVPAESIVPGDIVSLSSGDRVPADLRLLRVKSFQVEEAALTGESLPVEKHSGTVPPDATLGDRLNMAYAGTMVTYGRAHAVVVATGMHTELGRISNMMRQTTDLQTPLTKALQQIAHYLTVWIVGVTLLLFGISLWRGFPLTDALLVGITLAVAAIPEGLPAVVTIALAIGVQRMARRRAIVRKLPAVETLGSTTVVCSDKTGTLTRNEMTVQNLWTRSGSHTLTGVGYEPSGTLMMDDKVVKDIPNDVRELLTASVLCNDATLTQQDDTWIVHGDPTEGALIVAGYKLGIPVDSIRESNRKLDIIPFESSHKFMATLHATQSGEKRVFVKGAPEIVAKFCSRLSDGSDLQIPDLLLEVEKMAGQGMRVLAVAGKPMAHTRDELSHHDIESGLTLYGLEGLIDPPRPEAIAAIEKCNMAGIVVKMITGDHKGTAQAIGRELGILDEGEALTGARIDEMSDAEFTHAALKTNVFARVAPEHKLRLVRALQKEGHVVAMTGDGVNDAPALKQANIGVAMGVTGTAVSKEASDIVLSDDNFASITAAVEEGRRVYDNLVKSLAFLLPTNLGLAFILMFAVLFFPLQIVEGTPMPLMPMLPTQILWINLVAAVALALPLGFETLEPSTMQRAPRNPNASIMSPFVLFRTFLVAILMSAGAVGIFYFEYSSHVLSAGGDYTEAAHSLALKGAQTEAVTSVIVFQIYYLLNCRSLRHSVLRIGMFSNPAIYVGIGVVLLLHAAFVYSGFMNGIFHTVPLAAQDIGLSVLVGAVILPVIWAEKTIWNRVTRKRKETGSHFAEDDDL